MKKPLQITSSRKMRLEYFIISRAYITVLKVWFEPTRQQGM